MSMLARLATVGGVAPTYVDDVFSTYLYTGNGGTQTITNGIDLAGKGGLVWIKGRSGATDHALYDTARGATKDLVSNSAGIETTQSTGLTAFTASGFTVGALAKINTNADTYVSWAFREQPKFFDVVTYTGNGSNRTIAHSLGSVPGCIIVKRLTTVNDHWMVYHRSLLATENLRLSTTAAKATSPNVWNSTAPTSTVFSIGTNVEVNSNGDSYVAYLFAHDAGGFGASGTDNVITCGSYIGNGTSQKLTFGWEPQWFLFKVAAGTTNNWQVADNMRGMPSGSAGRLLQPNLNGSENSGYTTSPEADGLTITGSAADINQSGLTYIYIAIRRGPMRTPTTGANVFAPVLYAGNSSTQSLTGFGFPPDASLLKSRNQGYPANLYDKLRGTLLQLVTPFSSAELSQVGGVTSFDQNGITMGSLSQINTSAQMVGWNFRRAPGFFDIVCYTGTGSATAFSHNLGVVPEMMIVKRRSATDDWWVYDTATGNTKYQVLNSTATPSTSSTAWNNTMPTSSVITVGTGTPVNTSAGTYVAYLFATVPGVSKVGSYTGNGGTVNTNGTSQTINCGFSTGARFVLIKRTDNTGDWYVFDSARGIVSASDPYLLLNSSNAEVTTVDAVDADNSGFIVNQTSAENLNVTSATYIFLAIA